MCCSRLPNGWNPKTKDESEEDTLVGSFTKLGVRHSVHSLASSPGLSSYLCRFLSGTIVSVVGKQLQVLSWRLTAAHLQASTAGSGGGGGARKPGGGGQHGRPWQSSFSAAGSKPSSNAPS